MAITGTGNPFGCNRLKEKLKLGSSHSPLEDVINVDAETFTDHKNLRFQMIGYETEAFPF